MIEDMEFETFLYISKNKYQIFVYDKNNLKNLYNEELKNDYEIELDILPKFIDDNILAKGLIWRHILYICCLSSLWRRYLLSWFGENLQCFST